MLKPCARVLAFPVVYRLATNTLVPRSRPPSPSISLTPPIPPTFLFSLFATTSLSLSLLLSVYLALSFPLRNVDTLDFRRSFVRRFSFLLSPVYVRISRFVIRWFFFRKRGRERERRRKGERGRDFRNLGCVFFRKWIQLGVRLKRGMFWIGLAGGDGKTFNRSRCLLASFPAWGLRFRGFFEMERMEWFSFYAKSKEVERKV